MFSLDAFACCGATSALGQYQPLSIQPGERLLTAKSGRSRGRPLLPESLIIHVAVVRSVNTSICCELYTLHPYATGVFDESSNQGGVI